MSRIATSTTATVMITGAITAATIAVARVMTAATTAALAGGTETVTTTAVAMIATTATTATNDNPAAQAATGEAIAK